MDSLRKLSLGERIMSLTAVVLLFDLLFLPWHRVDLGIGGTYSRSGIESPNGFLGLLAALILAAIVARVVVSEFTSITLPTLPLPWERAELIGGAAVAGLLVAKLVFETSYLSSAPGSPSRWRPAWSTAATSTAVRSPPAPTRPACPNRAPPECSTTWSRLPTRGAGIHPHEGNHRP